MTNKRIQIPKPIERELLFRNQSVCCICQKSGIQIHHIDSDPANNSLANLCVLCVDHHAQASSVGTMTKGLDAPLLRKYKSEWEGIVLRRRQQGEKKSRLVIRSSDKQQLRFEIQKTGFSLPGTMSRAAFNQHFDYIYNWCLVEAERSDIVEVLGKVHWLLEEWQIQITARRLYEFFWHFVGPHQVPMNARDQKEIVSAIKLLEDLGVQAALLIYQPSTTAKIIESLRLFHEIGTWYKRTALTTAVLKALREMKKELEAGVKDHSNKKVATTKLRGALTLTEHTLQQLK